MGLLFNLSLICGGILLGLTALDKLDGDSDFFNKIAKVLMPFNTIIGGVALVLGILGLLTSGGLIFDLVGILVGLLLLVDVLAKVPAVGEFLLKLSKKLIPFKVTIGIGALVIGILNLFNII